MQTSVITRIHSRREFVSGLAVVAAGALTGCAGSTGAGGTSSVKLRLGHSGSKDWQGNLWAEVFAKQMAKELPGSKVQIFPNAQLGQDPALAQSVKLGTLDITVNGPTLEQYVPDLAVFDLPFLFSNINQAHKAQDGSVGKNIKGQFEQQGFHFLGWVDIGTRDVTNSLRPINSPSDLKGMKIRVPPGKIFVATFQALGTSVQSIDFGELYTALQQHVVDGEENPPTTVRVQKYYEVQKYLSLTQHIISFAYAVMNKSIYDRQSQETRGAIDRAGVAATKSIREFMAGDEAKSLDFLKRHGMLINRPRDIESFRVATQSVISSSSSGIQALASQIRSQG